MQWFTARSEYWPRLLLAGTISSFQEMVTDFFIDFVLFAQPSQSTGHSRPPIALSRSRSYKPHPASIPATGSAGGAGRPACGAEQLQQAAGPQRSRRGRSGAARSIIAADCRADFALLQMRPARRFDYVPELTLGGTSLIFANYDFRSRGVYGPSLMTSWVRRTTSVPHRIRPWS